MKKSVLAVMGVGIAALLTACSSGQSASQTGGNVAAAPAAVQERETITVSSEEEVKVAPDMAEVEFGVYTEAAAADECVTKNAEDIDRVIGQLKGFGIEERSIQTSGYNLNPRYDYSGNMQKLVGYEMRTSVLVSDVSVDKLGNLLSDCVKAGINMVESVTYMASSYDESYQEALRLAVASARAKAEALAEAGGCKVGAVAGMVEQNSGTQGRYTDYSRSMVMKEEAAMDMGASGMNVMPGELGVKAVISVEFYIER